MGTSNKPKKMQFQFNNVYVIGVKPAQLFSGDIN